MLNLLEDELNKLGVFEGNIPPLLANIANSISVNIPQRMKLTIAVSELVLFVSHFRRNISHWNGSNIPINAISFCIAKSGASKDSSVKAVRKCFKEGYAAIDEIRKERAVELAIIAAKADGKKNADTWAVYKEYYETPNLLFVAPSTVEGFIQHLNSLEDVGIGAGYIFSGEFASELATNPNMVENIKLLAELYDEGNKEVKVLKAKSNQSKAIENLPVSALLISSPDNVLYDDSIKKKFKTEFSSKLARRSFFNYSPDTIQEKSFDSIPEFIRHEKMVEEAAIRNRYTVSAVISKLTEKSLDKVKQDIGVDDDVRELFLLYKRYNYEIANIIDPQFPISKIARTHLQWKALKLSGALAVLHGRESITLRDYKAAIEFCELLDKDLTNFERELSKEPYEVFVDYVRDNAVNNELFVNLHTLRKLGHVPTRGTPLVKVRELAALASSYDEEGVYTVDDNGVKYEKLVKTEVIGVSYMPVSGSKETRKKRCDAGYEYYETTFSELALMLQEDFAYSPFNFKNGVRGKDNIISGCKWLALDVDQSGITDEEAHILLSDINHHIARTSDKSNEFKFRVLIELDAVVNIGDEEWRFFVDSIAKELSIPIDLLPKSQVFFSYAGRKVLSVVNQEPLPTKEHILHAASRLNDVANPKEFNSSQKSTMLKDPMTTFIKAYEARPGERSRKLIWVARYAQELGADYSDIVNIINDINDYWVTPISKTEIEKNIFSQIRRWFE